jgi:membrane fusion protein (multidrug efflux system)
MPGAPPSGAEATFGFPRKAIPQGPPPTLPRPPAPKRPKGRWFVGLVLLAACSFAAYKVWDAFFRYQAHGTVEGRIVRVPPPYEGVVQYVHVREGEAVRQGQLLLTVDSTELRLRQQRVANELKIAQANFTVEAAKLRWQAAFEGNNSQKAVADYYSAWGTFLQEQAVLKDLQVELDRTYRLYQEKAATQKELTLVRLQVQGQVDKIAKFRASLAELEERAEHAKGLTKKGGSLRAGVADTAHDQLQSALARTEYAQAELAIIQERLDQSRVFAPVSGVVVKLKHFTGEHCQPDLPLLEILEQGSVRVVLYMPQDASALLKVDDEADLVVEPYAQRGRCKVVRVGDRFEHPPTNIERQYWTKEKLLPVYLEPSDGMASWMVLRPNAVVKLPYKKLDLIAGALK